MRLIDADALVNLLRDLGKNEKTIPGLLEDALCYGALHSESMTPTIDAAPVVHGAWVPLDDDPPEDFECNVCGYVSTASFDCSGITPNAFPYCPMCGAKMDGGDNDGGADPAVQ